LIRSRRNQTPEQWYSLTRGQEGFSIAKGHIEDPKYVISRPIVKLWFSWKRSSEADEAGTYTAINKYGMNDIEWSDRMSKSVSLLASLCPEPGEDDETLDDWNMFCSRSIELVWDSERVQKWLSGCKVNHQLGACGRYLSTSKRKSTFLRLIDVQVGCLVDADAAHRYVALSYRWGDDPFVTLTAETEAALYKRGALAKVFIPGLVAGTERRIPRTIGDAIHVCRQLGERYLWVDALCIRQDSDADKAVQISNMGIVYQSATLTIVNAAKNASAVYPLPGILVGSRLPRERTAALGPYRVQISPRKPFSALLKESAWHSRGWTYQEELLSRRLLFFTSQGVFFRCREHFYSEDIAYEVPGDAKNQPVQVRMPARGWDNARISERSAYALVEFFREIREFRRRSLTLRSDTIDAFSGALKEYDGSIDGRANVILWGHPSAAFDYSLCWREMEHDPVARVEEFPSWSWAGWDRKVSFDLNPDNFRHIYAGRGIPTPSLYWGSILPGATWHYDQLQAEYGMHVAPSAARPDESVGGKTVQEWIKDSRHLCFHTSMTRLRVSQVSEVHQGVDTALTPAFANPDPTFERNHDFRGCPQYRLSANDGSDKTISWVRLNREWRTSQPDELKLDVIVLRASPYWAEPYNPIRGVPVKKPENWLLNLMCVVPKKIGDANEFTWERFALVDYRVKTAVWMALMPEERLVVLA